MSFDGPDAETSRRSDFEASTPRPIPTLESVGSSPLRLGLSCTVSPASHRMAVTAPKCRPNHAPSEVSSPAAFCQSRGATKPQQDPNPLVPLRPQGFTPSRRFAPLATCRACFIPVPLLGLPFEACSPHGAVRPLERRTPQVFGEVLPDSASPSGIEAHRVDPARGFQGLAGEPRRCLHGFVPSKASYDDRPRTELPARLPSRASPSWPRADLPVGAPGSLSTVAQPISLETGVAFMGFCTSSLSRLFGATPGLGYRFPSVPGPRRRRSVAPLRPSSRPCRSSSRQPFR